MAAWEVKMLTIPAAGTSADFMIRGLFSLELFGQTLWITTTHVSMLLVMGIILGVACLIRVKLKAPGEIPGLLQSGAEAAWEAMDGMVRSILGEHTSRFMNYIGSIFVFVLISNVSGIFGLRPPTADFGVTLSLGLMTFFLVQYQNIRNHRFGAVTELFKPIPLLFPINLIGEIAAPFSLGLRLFGNIISGTVIMALFYDMVPLIFKFGIPSILHVYFDLFSGCIQAYVFCMLSMVFINNKL